MGNSSRRNKARAFGSGNVYEEVEINGNKFLVKRDKSEVKRERIRERYLEFKRRLAGETK